jgi:hypothetical protein
VRDRERTSAPTDAAERHSSRDQAAAARRYRSRGLEGWLTTPLIAIIAVLCCAGPLLLGALAATGAGAWLAAHGYSLGAVALVVLSVLLVLRIRTPIRLDEQPDGVDDH